MKKLRAWLFVKFVRNRLKHGEPGDLRDCPMCGQLLQWYSKDGWLHMADGDADCYGAIGAGKGRA